MDWKDGILKRNIIRIMAPVLSQNGGFKVSCLQVVCEEGVCAGNTAEGMFRARPVSNSEVPSQACVRAAAGLCDTIDPLLKSQRHHNVDTVSDASWRCPSWRSWVQLQPTM
jgi:hypothetical protein